jgi:hypothetical protein
MEDELKSLPLSNRAGSNKALMIHQTDEPNQEVHRRTKRLVANKVKINTVIYDTNEEHRQLAQDIQDACKALYKWMNRGKVPPERKVVEYQQADGLGWFKLDFLADYADEELSYYDPDVIDIPDEEAPEDENPKQKRARQEYQRIVAELAAERGEDGSLKYVAGIDLEAMAYKKVTDLARRRCDPPFRLSAPDPVTIFYRRSGDAVELVIEKGKRSISALLENLSSRGLRLVNNRFLVAPEAVDALEEATIPENESLGSDYSNMVDYIEIRTRHDIVILVQHPRLRDGSRSPDLAIEDDYVKLEFENPFGPYSTGYIMVPGDVTGSHDPAHEFQPPILGTLSVAQAINVLSTIRLSGAIDTALRGKYIKAPDAQPAPQLSQAGSNKTGRVKDGQEIPVIPGEVRREEGPNVDLDKAEQYFEGVLRENRFAEVLAGDASSADSGHKLAIQVSQADTQLVPYQNSRAEATVELLMCCLYAAKKLRQTIYVKEIPDQELVALGKHALAQPIRAITPEMFDLDFNLIVTIGSETPVTKFAKWSALSDRYLKGTLSLETLMEESDIENVGDELARIFEGQMLVGMMRQAIPVLAMMLRDEVLAAVQGGIQVPSEGGNADGGGMPGAQASLPISGIGRLPGVGMNPAGPTVGDYGARVHEGAGDGQEGIG